MTPLCVCGKRTYSRDGAERAVRRLRQKGQWHGKPKAALNAYRCPIAPDGRWHVGHEPSATARIQAAQQGREHLAAAKARAREFLARPRERRFATKVGVEGGIAQYGTETTAMVEAIRPTSRRAHG